MFLDRVDERTVRTDGYEVPRVIPFAHLTVHNRNRAYHPALGRFMQRDPDATAMTLIDASA